MTWPVVVGLVLTAALGAAAWWVPPTAPRWRRFGAPAACVVGLAATGMVAALADSDVPRLAAVVLPVLAAAVGGGPVTAAVLRLVATTAPAPAAALRGGATIGVLERIAICATLLAGLPEGVAVVLAVKGLGRYPELRAPGTSERFIVGTFTSVLWAVACAGIGLL